MFLDCISTCHTNVLEADNKHIHIVLLCQGLIKTALDFFKQYEHEVEQIAPNGTVIQWL